VFLEAIARLRNDEKERCVNARQYDRPVSSEPWFVDLGQSLNWPLLLLYTYMRLYRAGWCEDADPWSIRPRGG